jgi:hypothetical protein
MPKKLFNITVHGLKKTWGFQFEGDDQYIEDWRADGLDVDEVIAESFEWEDEGKC